MTLNPFNREEEPKDIYTRKIGRDDGTSIALGHPGAEKPEKLPKRLRIKKALEAIKAELAKTPTDQLNVDYADRLIERHFKDLASFEDKKQRRRAKRVTAMTGEAQTLVTDRDEKVSKAQVDFARENGHLNNCVDQLGKDAPEVDPAPETPPPTPTDTGAPPAPGNDELPEKPWRRPIHAFSMLGLIVAVVGGTYGLGVDALSFKTLLDLLNSTLTERDNSILAIGFSGVVALIALGLGKALGRLRKGARFSVASAGFSMILIAMIAISFFIRALNGASQASSPSLFGGTAPAAFDPFGGSSGYLASAFYTSILVATSWITVQETRLITKFAPYNRAVKALAVCWDTLRLALGDLDLATTIRNEWLAEFNDSVEERDSAIRAHAASCNDLFATARRLLAAKLSDATVNDAIKFAPQIDLTRDVPDMVPPFYNPPADPPAVAAPAA